MYYFSSSYECDTSKMFTIKYHTNNLFNIFGKPDLQKERTEIYRSYDHNWRLCPVRGRGDIILFSITFLFFLTTNFCIWVYKKLHYKNYSPKGEKLPLFHTSMVNNFFVGNFFAFFLTFFKSAWNSKIFDTYSKLCKEWVLRL